MYIRVYWWHGESVVRLNVTLDGDHSAKLAALANRAHVEKGTIARSLLSQALDDADPDAANITEILDHIPRAFESAQEGLRQASLGQTIPIEDL